MSRNSTSRRVILSHAWVLLRWWSWCLLIFASALCIMLLVVRWLLKDRWDALGPVYYASAPVIVMGISLIVAIVWALRRTWTAAVGFSMAALVLFSATISSHRAPSVKVEEQYTILLWNTAGRFRHIREIAKTISYYDPDLVGLVETGRSSSRNRRRWEQELPGYIVSASNPEFVILSKQNTEPIAAGRAGANGAYWHVQAHLGRAPVDFIVADIQSDPLRSRREAIHDLTDRALATDGAAILMGDFNTPGDSVHYERLRGAFENAFETHGNGYAPTWPLPAPLLQIDHVWVRGLRVNRCEHGWSNLSDHRPVIVYLSPENVE